MEEKEKPVSNGPHPSRETETPSEVKGPDLDRQKKSIFKLMFKDREWSRDDDSSLEDSLGSSKNKNKKNF